MGREISRCVVAMAKNDEVLNEGSVSGYKERSVNRKHKYSQMENVLCPLLCHM